MDCHENTPYFHGMTTTAKDKTDEKQSGCCHCEPVRVWQSMENKKQQRQRLDCHKNTSCFFAMTKSGWIATETSCHGKTATANGNG